MGQYTWYVFSSVGIVVLSLAWLALGAFKQQHQIHLSLKRAQKPCR